MMQLETDAAETDSCLNCGSHVTPQFRRGFGDHRDRVHRCPSCDIYENLSAGSAAGKFLEERSR